MARDRALDAADVAEIGADANNHLRVVVRERLLKATSYLRSQNIREVT
jgi:hypothetical protein